MFLPLIGVVGIFVYCCVPLLGVNMKLICTIVCKTTPDLLSFVLQCKCACKVQDALAHGLKMFKKSESVLRTSRCQKGDMNHVPYS